MKLKATYYKYSFFVFDNISGEVVLPHYKNIYSAFSSSAIRSSAYGLLTGRRYSSITTNSHKLLFCDIQLPTQFYLSVFLLSLFRFTFYSTLHAPAASLPMKLPWIVIPCKEYWHLCRNSVYACRKHPYHNPLPH